MGDLPDPSSHGIVILGEPKFALPEWEQLAKDYKVKYAGSLKRPEAIALLKQLDAEGGWDAIINLGGPTGPVNEELYGGLTRLGYAGGMGAGYDGVDVDWLASVGAWYANAPTGVADPVAATAVMMILQCTRNASAAEAEIRRGGWRKDFELIIDTRGLTVGIFGMGTIGKLARDKCQAFGMNVIYHNRKPLPADEEKGAKYVSFEDLLKKSDVITLHCDLNKETTHLLGEKEFAAMKKGVIVINTSRGKVVDEQALVAALKSGQVARAGLDCFEFEPEIDPYLRSCERVALYPHQAGASWKGIHDKEIEVITNVREWITKGRPRDAVNRPVGKS